MGATAAAGEFRCLRQCWSKVCARLRPRQAGQVSGGASELPRGEFSGSGGAKGSGVRRSSQCRMPARRRARQIRVMPAGGWPAAASMAPTSTWEGGRVCGSGVSLERWAGSERRRVSASVVRSSSSVARHLWHRGPEDEGRPRDRGTPECARARQPAPEHRVWVLVVLGAGASSDPEASPSDPRAAGAQAEPGNMVFKYWRYAVRRPPTCAQVTCSKRTATACVSAARR